VNSYSCPHCHQDFEMDRGEAEEVLCPHCNGMVSVPERDLESGECLGGFEIVRLIGRGGMGNVYMAIQLSMNRHVALKVLLKSMTRDKEALRQFLNEARVSGQMNHRNIISAIDAGEVNDTYFLVTAFVDGEDLERCLERESRIPEKDALRIALKIGDALDYAWANYKLLHKDIKPGNIMIDSRDEVYLMDMGIAQFAGESALDGDDHVLGSPFYMSPEQTMAMKLDWSSDLYSLGATLYHMIVGVPPYDADDVTKIMRKHSDEPFPDPLKRNIDVKISKRAIGLLRKMMEKKPEDRFESWEAFRKTAEAALKALSKPEPLDRTQVMTRKIKKMSASGKKGPIKLNNGPRVAVRRKSGGGAIQLLGTLVVLAAAVVAGYFYYIYAKKVAARRAFSEAEQYLKRHYDDYPSSIDRFRQALAKAGGTEMELIIADRIDEVLAESKVQKKLLKEYEAAKERAKKLIARRKFDEAVALLRNSTRNIKDRYVRKEAATRIHMIQLTASRVKPRKRRR